MTARWDNWARNAAIHYVERYSTSEANLKRVLDRKAKAKKRRGKMPEDFDPSESISKAISFLVENGFVNDTSFAEMKARTGKRKGKSRSKVVMELAGKGVSRELAENSVEDYDDTAQAIQHARRKRLGPFRRTEADDKALRREYGSFARAGFSPSAFRKVLEMSPEEAEQYLFDVEDQQSDTATILP